MNQLQQLRDKIDELTEENRQLREAMYGELPIFRPYLTPSESRVLSALYRASGVATRKSLCIAQSPNSFEGNSETLDVIMCSLRRKTASYGIEIITIRESGYELTPTSRPIIDAMVKNLREQATLTRRPRDGANITVHAAGESRAVG